MAEDWNAVAAEVAEGLAEVEFIATLEKPGVMTGPSYDPVMGPPTLHRIGVVEEESLEKDATGTLTGRVIKKLTMNALGIEPTKQDRVILNLTPDQVTATPEADRRWLEIDDVMRKAPGGVPLLYQIILSN